MKILRTLAMLLMVVLIGSLLTSCMTNTHTVGSGPQTGEVVKSRQWYALWGAVKMGNQDTKTEVGDKTDYKIETYDGPIDWLVNFFLGWLSIRTRTIKITK